jgi:integrase
VSPGAGPAREYRGPAGLREKLMAAVRPEFRARDLVFDPRDPVFGGPPCAVSGCGRPHRVQGLCTAHWQRWREAGRVPALDEFTATADPILHGHLPLNACVITGCNYGQRVRGLCQRHHRQWCSAGRPDLPGWRAPGAPPPPRAEPPRACRIGYCDLWTQGTSMFCLGHDARWKYRGRPDPGEFAASCENPGHGTEHFDLRGLPAGLRLEIQYVLQCLGDEQQAKLRPLKIRPLITILGAAGMSSLLEQPEEWWTALDPGKKNGWCRFILDAHRRVEALAFGAGWDTEYPRDTWRLRNLGIEHHEATVSFGNIPQPWLKDLAKRHARWQLATGLSAGTAAYGARAVTRFAAWLASLPEPPAGLAGVTRPLLERYLAVLQAEVGGRYCHGRFISDLSGFLKAVRQHGWDGTLPASAAIYPEDCPPRGARLPRGLAAHVMAQVEQPANLARQASPAYRLITLILIRCGLRISSATGLSFDCTVTDADGAPYLLYDNTKMKREALVPVDDEILALIGEQKQRALHRFPGGTPVLFPRQNRNLSGRRPVSSHTYRSALYDWLEDCDIRDEHGQPVHLTPHQWRHTLGTTLINKDVPQHIVQKILDHDSPLMTAHYARLSDKTVREHWERARKVNAEGDPVQISPDGLLGDASWAKQQLSRATQSLPNGYCQLPLIKTCPHANSCLTCPMFLTTAEFLPQHHAQRQAALQIISAAEASGHARVAEMNKQVAGNLDKIITSLEAGEDNGKKAAGNAP